MFGYVVCDRGELLMREYDTYRGIYCGLCKNLRSTAGPFARLFLSYDMTFLALMGLALLPRECKLHHGRCAFHPLQERCFVVEEEAVSYAASASVLLGYYKLRDDVADEGFWGRLRARISLWPFARMRRKVLRRDAKMAALDAILDEQMRALAALERTQASLDAYCHPFGEMLAALFAGLAPQERERRILREFGYFSGKWIYLMDAADDREEDARRGRFNALTAAFPRGGSEEAEDYRQRVEKTAGEYLGDTLTMLQQAFHLLDVRAGKGILENIVFRGMPLRQKAVLSAPPGK